MATQAMQIAAGARTELAALNLAAGTAYLLEAHDAPLVLYEVAAGSQAAADAAALPARGHVIFPCSAAHPEGGRLTYTARAGNYPQVVAAGDAVLAVTETA